MDVHQKYQLITSVGDECIEVAELYNLLSIKKNYYCYDGFEPSGRMSYANHLRAMGISLRLFTSLTA